MGRDKKFLDRNRRTGQGPVIHNPPPQHNHQNVVGARNNPPKLAVDGIKRARLLVSVIVKERPYRNHGGEPSKQIGEQDPGIQNGDIA